MTTRSGRVYGVASLPLHALHAPSPPKTLNNQEKTCKNQFDSLTKLCKRGKLKLKLGKNTLSLESSRDYCVRSRWNVHSLRAVGAKFVVGQRLVVSFSKKGSHLDETWEGIVKTKGAKRTTVDYCRHGCSVFPPDLRFWTVKSLVITPFEPSTVQLRHRRCAVGDVIVHRFCRDNGPVSTWRGKVVAKSAANLLVQYKEFHSTLRFPIPPNSRAKTVSFWFVKNPVANMMSESMNNSCPLKSGGVINEDRPPLDDISKQNSFEKAEAQKDQKSPTTLKLATLNCRSLRATWRIAELGVFLRSRSIQVVCLQETRWKDNTRFKGLEKYNVHQKCCDPKGVGGTALLIHKEVHTLGVKIDDFSITAELGWRKGSISVSCCYAPHRGHADAVREAYWEGLTRTTTTIQENHSSSTHPHPHIILGDLNSELHRDDKLESFLDTTTFLLMNEHFTKPAHKQITFYGPKSRKAILDCCLIPKRFRSTISNVSAVKAPFPSDHRALLVSASFKIQQRAEDRPPKPSPKPDYTTITPEFTSNILSHLAMFSQDGLQYLNAVVDFNVLSHTCTMPHSTYSDFVLANRIASVSLIPKPAPKRHKLDSTTHLLLVHFCHFYTIPIESELPPDPPPKFSLENVREPLRRIYDYRGIERTYTKEEQVDITQLVRSFASTLHKNPAHAWSHIQSLIKPRDGKQTPAKSSPSDIINFFQAINGVPKPDLPAPTYTKRVFANIVKIGPFSTQELHEALSTLRSGKAIGLDGVPAEVLKLPAFHDLLLTYANDYLVGCVPLEVLRTRLTLVPKKGDLSIVSNYRGIAIISVFLKLLNRLLLNRLRVLDPHMRYNQNGFRQHRGTGEQGLAMKILADAINDGLDCNVAFVDFSKAFDSVTFSSVRAALVAFSVPTSIIDAVFNCYTNHQQSIPSVGATWRVETGVLQGDTLAPFLFVLLLDCILHDSLDATLGLRLHGAQHQPPPMSTRQRDMVDESKFLTDLDYADDLALLIPGSSANVQQQLRNLEAGAAAANLKLNVGKNKTEIIPALYTQQTFPHLPLFSPISLSDGRDVTFTTKYTYLGQQPFVPIADFHRRKGLAWSIIHKFDPLWKNASAPMGMKLMLLQTFALSAMTHGSHLWPATVKFQQRLDSSYKQMLRYCCWRPGLHRLDQPESYNFGSTILLSTLVTQLRVRILGHALRHDQALLRLVDGSFYPPARHAAPAFGPTPPRPRSTLQQLALDTGIPREEWTDAAQNRKTWRAIGDHAAYLNEYRHWHTYGNLRRHRWNSITRILTRTNLRIAETHATLLLQPVDQDALNRDRVLEYHHPTILNLFQDYAIHPLFIQPPPIKPQNPSRPPPHAPKTKWIWTAAVTPDTAPPPPRTTRNSERAAMSAT